MRSLVHDWRFGRLLGWLSLGLLVALAPLNAARAGRAALSQSAPLRPTALRLPLAPTRTTTASGLGADPASWCETAVTTAEYVHRLPSRLLTAISLAETGRIESATGRFRPWPWTINAEGLGQFFQTRQQAIRAVKALQARGVRSIDVGCLQVNLMYHPDAFASLDVAFDPRSNANYAARFLNSLYADSKDWTRAIAAYHSETPALGAAYRTLVLAHWQNRAPQDSLPRSLAYADFVSRNRVYGANAYNIRAYGDRAYRAFAPQAQPYGDLAASR